ncbi:MAG TPA: hypothetical protein PKM34_02470 [Bacteroidales bacterium]|nr:hypothetical protein [Bacteroidales bacterium]
MKTGTFYLRNLHRILLPFLFLLLLSPAFPQRISELPAATYIGIGDLMPIVQNGVTKKLPFAGLTGSLSFLKDSLFVKYRCHKIKGASQWYFSGDTIYIDTCYISIPPGLGRTDSLFFSYGCHSGETKWYYSSDTIYLDTCFAAVAGDTCHWYLNQDTLINKNGYKILLTDSVYFSNYAIPHLEEGEKFMGFLTLKSYLGNVKQLAYATPELAADSLAVNFDTLSCYQQIGDTNQYDATKNDLHDSIQMAIDSVKNWVEDQNYVSGITSSGYSMQFGSASISSSDGVTLYFMSSNYSSTSTVARVYVPKTGTIKTCYFWIWLGSPGSCSNEPMTCYIRLNSTTDYAIATVSTTDGGKQFVNTDLSIPVSQGDFLSIKSVNPIWQTNPSGGMNGCTGIIFIE